MRFRRTKVRVLVRQLMISTNRRPLAISTIRRRLLGCFSAVRCFLCRRVVSNNVLRRIRLLVIVRGGHMMVLARRRVFRLPVSLLSILLWFVVAVCYRERVSTFRLGFTANYGVRRRVVGRLIYDLQRQDLLCRFLD